MLIVVVLSENSTKSPELLQTTEESVSSAYIWLIFSVYGATNDILPFTSILSGIELAPQMMWDASKLAVVDYVF